MKENKLTSHIIPKIGIAVLFLSACTNSLAESGVNDPNIESITQSSPIKAAHVTPTTDSELEYPATLIPGPPQTSTISPDSEPIHPIKTKYILTAELDYGRHHLKVDEEILYYNNAPISLSEILLMVEPLYYPNVFHLKNMTWDDGETVHDYHWDEGQLRIPLQEPLEPGDGIQIDLTFELDIPSPEVSPHKRPIPFGYTNRQTNLVDWYPFIPPYIPGEGWQAHKPGYYGEHLVYETADFEVHIKLSDNKGNLTIAASSPAEVNEDWHYYRHEDARNFVWSVSHEYQILTDKAGEVTIMSYFFPAHSQAGEAVLKATSDALSLYTELFGPYPRDTLTAVEADFLDGMEFDGLYFLSNGFYNLYTNTPGEYLVAIAVHETAHQWWYAMVGNDQAMEPWLDEALCTYSERLFYENRYPEALEWWWNYRIFYYHPQGTIDDSIYNPHGKIDAYRSYRDAVYLRGALFLEEIRSLIGEEAFFTFFSDYTQTYRDKIVTTNEFLRHLQTYTQEDIQPIIEKYFSQGTLDNLN